MKLKDLQKQLERLYETDQDSIRSFKDGSISSTELEHITSENTAFIKRVIQDFGFPFINITSEKAYRGAFLVVQHSGDSTFIDQISSIFRNADEHQVNKRDLAFLIDRSRVLKKLPQLYGTQFKKRNDGSVEFIEVEDPNNLDTRRRELGMEAFSEYQKLAGGL